MKKFKLFTLFIMLFACSFGLKAQFAGDALSVGAGNYVSIPDNTSGYLDFTVNLFAIELWVFPTDIAGDQKIIGKTGTSFPLEDSYVMGANNGVVNFELLIDVDNYYAVTAPSAYTANVWTHIAVTHNNDVLTLYINGEIAAQNTTGPINVSYVEQPMIIGGAPWFYEDANFLGQIDEIRKYGYALDQSTIQAYMHKDIDAAHPAINDVYLYHQYNSTSNGVETDQSPWGNNGTLMNGSAIVASTTPSLGTAVAYEPAGIWANKCSNYLANLTFLCNDIQGTESAVFISEGNYQFIDDGPSGYDAYYEELYISYTQGQPRVDLTYNLNTIDWQSTYSDVALVESDGDLAGPNTTVYSGSLNGNNLTVSNIELKNEYYYFLVFKEINTAVHAVEDIDNTITLAPNPSTGVFNLTWENQGQEDARVVILDITGKQVYEGNYAGNSTQQIDLSNASEGMYIVQIHTEDKIISKKLAIQ